MHGLQVFHTALLSFIRFSSTGNKPKLAFIGWKFCHFRMRNIISHATNHRFSRENHFTFASNLCAKLTPATRPLAALSTYPSTPVI